MFGLTLMVRRSFSDDRRDAHALPRAKLLSEVGAYHGVPGSLADRIPDRRSGNRTSGVRRDGWRGDLRIATGAGIMPLVSIASFLPGVVAHVTHDPLEDMKGDRVHFLPSTARKAIALDMVTYWRIYELLKHYDRVQCGGTGKMILDEKLLSTIASAARLSVIRVTRIIRHAPMNLFWNLTISRQWRDADILYIELLSRRQVEVKLSHIAEENGVYDARRVSKRKAYLKVEDFQKLQRLEALCFAAWINDRKKGKDAKEYNPAPKWDDDAGSITIPLYALSSAWGRDHKIIQKWRQLAEIGVSPNVGYINDKEHGDHLVQCLEHDLDRNGVYHWRDHQRTKFPRANTYYAPDSAQRGTRSLCRKTAADLCNGGDASKMRTNHVMPVKGSERAAGLYKRISRLIDTDPLRTHYLFATVLDKGAYRMRPTGLFKLHYLAGSRADS